MVLEENIEEKKRGRETRRMMIREREKKTKYHTVSQAVEQEKQQEAQQLTVGST